MTHTIKLNCKFVEPVLFGDKCFEVRLNDRGYQKGDRVRFKVVDIPEITIANANIVKDLKSKAGALEKLTYEITYVLNGWGLKNGYVVFGISETNEDDTNDSDT